LVSTPSALSRDALGLDEASSDVARGASDLRCTLYMAIVDAAAE
jgi:hypothetical protein